MSTTVIKNRPKIPRNKYGYLDSKSTGNSSSSSVSISGGGGGGSSSEFSATIWGLSLTNGATIDGDLQVGEGNIGITKGDLTLTEGNITNTGNITSSGLVKGAELKGTTTYTDYLEANTKSNIGIQSETIFSEQATMDNGLAVDVIKSNAEDEITVQSTLKTAEIKSMNHEPLTTETYDLGSSSHYWNNGYIKSLNVHNLDVTGNAHFHELVIDKIKACGGAIIISPADGFTIEAVAEGAVDSYLLYWKAHDDEGNKITNMWESDDLAICKNFNQAKEGTSYEVKNVFYWTLVMNTDDNNPVKGSTITDITSGEVDADTYYHYIEVSANVGEFVGELQPEAGLDICMLGSLGGSADRQSAIMISAYGTDKFTEATGEGLTAPFYAQYQGINDFSLISHRKSYFDSNSAKFVGDFQVTNNSTIGGKTIDTYIQDSNHPPKIQGDYWYIWDTTTLTYVKSIKAKGVDGTDASYYQLIPLTEDFYMTASENTSSTKVTSIDAPVYLYCGYKVILCEGESYTEESLGSDLYVTYTIYKKDGTTVKETHTITANSFGDKTTPYETYAHSEDLDLSYYKYVLFHKDSEGVAHEVDSRVVNLTTLAGAFFSVTNKVLSRVTDSEGNISTITQEGGTIDLRVGNLKQKIKDVGINVDATSQLITLNASNTLIQGTLSIDPTEEEPNVGFKLYDINDNPCTLMMNESVTTYDVSSVSSINMIGSDGMLAKSSNDRKTVISTAGFNSYFDNYGLYIGAAGVGLQVASGETNYKYMVLPLDGYKKLQETNTTEFDVSSLINYYPAGSTASTCLYMYVSTDYLIFTTSGVLALINFGGTNKLPIGFTFRVRSISNAELYVYRDSCTIIGEAGQNWSDEVNLVKQCFEFTKAGPLKWYAHKLA